VVTPSTTSSPPSGPKLTLAAGLIFILAGASLGGWDLRGLTASLLATQAGLLCLAFAGAKWHGEPAAAGLGLTPPVRPLSLGTGLAVLGGMVLLSFTLNFLLEYSGIREHSALAELEHRFATSQKSDLPYLLVAVALLPAIAEELLFRGLLLGRIASQFGATAGLVLSALLFGVIHLDVAQGLAACVLGLYLGGVRLRTGSVHAPILCHASNNALAVLAPHFVPFG
jgi:membrane protease YdiL (CAAX protease family)